MSFKYKVLMTDYAWPSVEPERQVLAEIDTELIVAQTGTEAEFIDLASQVDGILTTWAQVTAAVIKAAHRCKVIGRCGIGLDNIDVDTATTLGIAVTNVPAYCVDEVSDHAMALLLACARRTPVFDRRVKSGNWIRDVVPPMRRLRGQKLGIIGFGRIGKAIAPKAKAFGLEILVYSPRVSDQVAQAQGVTVVDFPELLAESDFITIHAPLTDETEGLLDEKAFRQMKPTAYVINTARGGIIETGALHTALTEGWIAGAGLDVFPEEPPRSDEPLLELDNVIWTPHAAFVSEEAIYDLEVTAAREVARVLTGQMPESVVNPEVLNSPVLRARELAVIK
ncbi:MAG: C-terminal binding protein [Candidatus Poribacteria bacterium]|nr:C-terminal binding protein [Candidatus Poribacteria bacterium]